MLADRLEIPTTAKMSVVFSANAQRERLKERKGMGINMYLLVEWLEIPTTSKKSGLLHFFFFHG